MIRRFAVILSCCAVLAACQTPYQDMGLTGGVKYTQIDSKTIRISGRGNGFTEDATVQNYVLLKAAELTKRNGFDVFEVVNARDVSRSSTVGFSTAEARSGRGWASGFGSLVTGEIIFPREDAIIKMTRGTKPTDAPPNMFDAAEVIHFIGGSIKGYVPPPGVTWPANYSPTPPASGPAQASAPNSTPVP